MKENKYRIEYIDILRGFCIFLVTFGHLLENSGYRGAPLFQFIYSFHMPVFITISGFVMAFSLERKSASNVLQLNFMKDFVVNKFKRIMLPYYVWSLLVVPLFFYNYDGSFNYINRLYSVFVNNTSYWFLPCLFDLSIVYIIYKFVSSRISNNVFLKSITLLSLYAILLVIYKVTQYDFLRSISSYFVPFLVGVFMAEYKMVYKLVTENSKVYTFCLLSFGWSVYFLSE